MSFYQFRFDDVRKRERGLTVDTSIHGSFDKGTKVLVFGRSFSGDFVESSSIGSVAHGLILEIALSSLVAYCTPVVVLVVVYWIVESAV